MIIGITGTIGAGKGTIVEYLISKGFKHCSAREFITQEIKSRNLEINRDNMVIVANELRKKYGSSHVAEQLYLQANNQNAVLESLRTVGEIEALQSKPNFYLFAIDANQKIRYDRITKRKSSTDKISFQKFQSQEAFEMENEDPTKQNLRKCIEMADFKFNNNSTIEDLQNQINQVLIQII